MKDSESAKFHRAVQFQYSHFLKNPSIARGPFGVMGYQVYLNVENIDFI